MRARVNLQITEVSQSVPSPCPLRKLTNLLCRKRKACCGILSDSAPFGAKEDGVIILHRRAWHALAALPFAMLLQTSERRQPTAISGWHLVT